jgi:hypothetical protein
MPKGATTTGLASADSWSNPASADGGVDHGVVALLVATAMAKMLARAAAF